MAGVFRRCLIDWYFVMKRLFLLVALMAATGMGVAQKAQEPETDPVILNRIAEWQDLKFGFMMHWGMYAQWGVVESWSICNEPWIDRKGMPYVEYKQRYQALNKTFNPTKFDASKNNFRGEERVISADDSKVTVCVIPTDEELMIATDTMNLL